MSNRVKKAMVLISILALCAGTMTACADKTQELIKLVDAGDFGGAYDYYDEEIDGTNKEDDICDEFADEMEDRYEDITDKCFEGEYDEDDIEDLVELLEDTDVDEDDYEEYYAEWQTAFMSKQSYEDALDYMDDGDYSLAASYFELVDERDSNYDDAMEKIGETELLIFDDDAQMIEDWISLSDREDIHIAFDAIAEKRQVHSDNEDITERLDELYSMAEDALMSHIRQLLDESRHADARFILEGSNVTDETYDEAYSMIEAGVVVYAQSCVDEYFAEYDFDGAQSCIELLILDYEGCSELEEIYANLEDAFVQKVTEDVNVLVGQGDYEVAVDILSTAIEELGDNEELEALYQTYSKEDIIEGIRLGMTEDELKTALLAFHDASCISAYETQHALTGDPCIEYRYEFASGIADYDISLPSYIEMDVVDNRVVRVCIVVGAEWNLADYSCLYPYDNAELGAEFDKAYAVLSERFGEGEDMLLSYPDYGYLGCCEWNDTVCGNIRLVYGTDLWMENSGINEVCIAFTDPEYYAYRP